MWVSIPIQDDEIKLLEQLCGRFRLSKDSLYRKSDIELALVTSETWAHWELPVPPAPIISVEIESKEAVDELLACGVTWEKPFYRTKWGVEVGFLRFPSGLLVEVKPVDSAAGSNRK